MNRKTIKMSSLMLAGVLTVGGLAGCGQGNQGANEAAKENAGAAKEKIQIRYATGDAGPAVTVQEQIVKAFNESQDNIEVKLETYGTAFDQKLTAAIGSDNAPDVVKMWNFPAYSQSLVPLDDKINGLEDKADFYETVFNYADMDGSLYGMPIGFSTRALHYNKKLVEEAGVKVSDNWTMDDLKAAAKATTKGDTTGLYFYYNPDPYAFESILWSNGGEWINDEGKPVVNSEANIEAIQYMHDLIYKDKVAYAGNLADDFGQVIGSGKYAFGEMGRWFINAIKDAGVDLGIAPMPGFKDGSSMSVVHASFLSVTKSSKNADAAWEFIKFYTSPESIKTLSEIEMPVRESVANELGYLNDEQIKPFYTMLERSVSKRPSLVKTVKWPEVNAEIATALEAVFVQDKVDIKNVLDETQSKIESIMQ
ncbi:putative arabinose-binding protein precursor [compost metagenome]